MNKLSQFFLLIIILISCQKEHPVPLIDNFRSRMTLEEARMILLPSLREWKVHIDNPVDQHYVVEIAHYESLGLIGNLSLSFVNGQLDLTCFSTENMKGYIEQIEQLNNIKLEKTSDISSMIRADIHPNVSIFSTINLEEICWWDKTVDPY